MHRFDELILFMKKYLSEKNGKVMVIPRNLFFVIKSFRTIVFIFIISTTFRPLCPPAFFMCLSNAMCPAGHIP